MVRRVGIDYKKSSVGRIIQNHSCQFLKDPPHQQVRIVTSVKAMFSSVQSLSRVWLFATPWIAAHQASLSVTNSQSPPTLMSIESVMPSSHVILCRPLLFLPPTPPSIRVFPNVSSSHQVAKVLEFQRQHKSSSEHPGHLRGCESCFTVSLSSW